MDTQLETIIKKPKLNRITQKEPLTLKKSILMIVLMSLAGFFIQSIIQNGFISGMHFVYLIYPAVVVLNMLPVFLLISFIYFITGKIWIGALVAYLPLVGLNIANYFKTFFRDEPLKMSDLNLISEMQNITQNYQLKISLGIVIGVIFAIAAVIFAAKYFKSQKLKIPVRLIGATIAVCIMILSYNFIYTDRPLYEDIPTFAIEYYDTDMANHHGLLYSLLVSADSSTYDMPEGYTDEKVEELLAQNASATPAVSEDKKINVIAIMGEAFFDVTRGGTAQFEEGKNPYENYEKIKAQGYSGKMVVPGFGGSTESTEFEFLTGASQYLLDSSMPTAYKTYATQPAYSLVRYFKDNGYDAVAIHPGYAWFYNRKNSYANLGFDKFITREDMDTNAPTVCGYISDQFTTKQILGNYLEHYEKSPETPYFSFTVTIQNHGPYATEDTGRDGIYTRPDNLSDENYHIINNYLNGVRDTDKLLGDIVDFAAERQEPVVVLFFGDHLPYLDEKIECFEALGYNISHKSEQGIENKYCVEYVMWSNSAAKQVIKESRGSVKRGEGPEISSGFLGAELLDYMGAEKSAYFEFVNKVQDKINVISSNYYKSGKTRMTSVEGENAKLLEEYKILQYYNFRRYNKD